ncbi:MAG: protein arginine kinase [Clostridiales bacterium]|nr:protein arginine kinase [Clostridiales bacterium]
MSWINEVGPSSDIILSSRVRLARNLADTPFPTAMDKEEMDTVIQRVRRGILGSHSDLKDDYQFLIIKDLSPVDREILVEKHLASPDLIKNYKSSAILVDKVQVCSIMVNEEDHIRLQCIFPGNRLKDALEYLQKVDDTLDAELPYAFDDGLGYLSCCPTNLGTGMRASIMMHLPALAATGQMKGIISTLPKVGMAVRGLYGEGSEAGGDIFQISNQITLGASEEEIIGSLEAIVGQVLEKERQTRRAMAEHDRVRFEDGIWRAYGTITHAKVMDLNEFMDLLSKVRLGVEMGIIPDIDISSINGLMILGQPAHLKKYEKDYADIKDLDILRAKIISKKLRDRKEGA